MEMFNDPIIRRDYDIGLKRGNGGF